MRSHAQLPIADHVDGDLFKVYFATRTHEQISRIGWALLELAEPVRLLEVSAEPVLEPGPVGTFDEHGVLPSCVVRLTDRRRMYYVGWNRGYRAPLFYASIGLAESFDGGETWHKFSCAPIMARGPHDPCLVTSPHVVWSGDRYRMTYVSGTRWTESDGQLHSYYHIKYAESQDGISWVREGRVAIDYASHDETNVARPWVVEREGRLCMFFAYVRGGRGYRLGYAESADWTNWVRSDEQAGLEPGPSCFDDEMIAYPSVVRHGGRWWMFYNGNRFGMDGLCVAVQD